MAYKHKTLSFAFCIGLLLFLVVLFTAFPTSSTNATKTLLLQFLATHAQGMKDVSVYVYQFKTKKEFGIHENDSYLLASLLKVPCLIAYLKLAETQPALLQQTLEYPRRQLQDFTQTIAPVQAIQPGQTYTIEQLLTFMIRSSDNNAATLLFTHLDSQALAQVFTDVSLPPPDLTDINYSLSPKDYAKFFIVLYQASYLNRTFSDKALTLLSRSEYTDGLVAGVPKNIVVAHKFGERTLEGLRRVKQFHDCGIVSAPTDPYLLCVMTDGDDLHRQAQLIQAISSFVYHHLTS